MALTDLSRCDYLAQLHDAYRQYALPLLQSLQQRWEEDPVSVEIIDKIADLYLSQIGELPQEDTVKRADKTRELYRLLQRGFSSFPGTGGQLCWKTGCCNLRSRASRWRARVPSG